MKKYEFTIVIPVHNGMPYGKPFIKYQIESILSQTYRHFNLIILENCSNDGTNEFLQTLNDERITIVPSDKYLEVDDNWARVAKMNKSEYLVLAMADDLYKPNYLSEIIKLIEKYPEACVYRTNIEIIDKDSNTIGYSNIPAKINFEKYLEGRLRHTYFETFQGYCFRSDFYDRVDGCQRINNKGFYMDDKLVLVALEETDMPVSPEYACCYRSHSASCSGSGDYENDIIGFNHIFNWIWNHNNKNYNLIIKKYLPFHIKEFSKFYNNEQVNEFKKIYQKFNINENDLYHKFLYFKDKYFYIRRGNKKINLRFLFLKISWKVG